MNIVINFVGDIGLFKSYELQGIDPTKEIKLPNADYNIGNLEFIGHFHDLKGAFFDVQDHYFPSIDYLNTSRLERFHYLSLANNHIMDFGADGVRRNIKILESKSIKYFGYGCKREFNFEVIERNNIRIALIGCVGNGRWSKKNNDGCGPDNYDIERLNDFIKRERRKYNHIIIYMHWGSELVDIPSPRDIKNAHQLIDSGASAIIGAHSHIIQGIECYNHGIIAYGLGSFIYRPNEELGYIKDKKREFSICLNLNFNENAIVSYKTYYYLLDNKDVPQLLINPSKRELRYFLRLNKNFNNAIQHHLKKYITLLFRETYSLLLRFIINPRAAANHYILYLKDKISL